MRFRQLLVCLAAIAWMGWAASRTGAQDDLKADLLLTNGLIVDGSGRPGVIGDVAIRGSQIVAVGTFEPAYALRTVDCTGLIVCPGFIDLHSHSDAQIVQPATRANMNFVRQGCTTIITGNCGAGPVDAATYLAKVEQFGAGTNVGHLLPQGALREQVVGLEDRKARPEELEQMKSLVDRAMRDGCWGLSTGLIYVPSSYADTAELVALSEVVAAHGGLYASHIRGEGTELLASIEEVLRICRAANLPVHISHLKCSGRDAWGLAGRALSMIESARARGLPVTADQYPYVASSTSLEATVIPPWARAGGVSKLMERWDDPELGPTLQAEIQEEIRVKDDGHAIRFARYARRPDWIGKSLAQVAADEGRPMLEIVRTVATTGGAAIVHFSMNEDEVRAIMKLHWVATASDGRADLPGVDRPHPRLYGTFPRKIGHYALREQWIPVEQAIRSATGLPADIFGLSNPDRYAAASSPHGDSPASASALPRGYLKPGMAADVVILDPKTYIDTATFDDPARYATGVRHLWVNGVATIIDGEATGALGGVPLRHKSRLVPSNPSAPSNSP